MSHTILLVQPGRKPESRTYSDYESVNECLEGVRKGTGTGGGPGAKHLKDGQALLTTLNETANKLAETFSYTGVCKIYEEYLKRMNPTSPSITYDISQLFDFIDQLADLSCLVYQKTSQTYIPHNKEWIKEKIYELLRRQAGR